MRSCSETPFRKLWILGLTFALAFVVSAEVFAEKKLSAMSKVKRTKSETAGTSESSRLNDATHDTKSNSPKKSQGIKSVVKQATASDGNKSRLSGVMFNRLSSNFQPGDSPDHAMSLGSTTLLSYRIAERWQALGIFGFSRQMTGEERFRLRNTELRLMFQSYTFAEGIRLLNGLNTVLPTNLDSRQLESLYVGTGLATRLAFDLTAHGFPGFSGWYDLNLNKNFHEFNTAVNGEWNTDVMLEHFILTFYSFSERWAVMLAGDLTHNWDYSGGVSNNWSFTQELDFSPTKSIQLGIGHTNGGSVLGANGRSYNLGLFNPFQSIFYLSANFVL